MPALSLGWFGKGSEGEALASDLPQICRRFGLSISRLLALSLGSTLRYRFVSWFHVVPPALTMKSVVKEQKKYSQVVSVCIVAFMLTF